MKPDNIVISEKKFINKFFKRSEIQSIERLSLRYSERKKVVVYSPLENVEEIAIAMHKSGAGIIGEYEMCSFRISGTGTYMPGSKANPHKGARQKLSKEPEMRIEVECDSKVMDDVIDAMLKVHPYEEAVYEIYDFMKRENVSDGSIVSLKKKMKYSELLSRLNKKISALQIKDKYFKKVAIMQGPENDFYTKKSRLGKADAIIFVNKKVNLIIL